MSEQATTTKTTFRMQVALLKGVKHYAIDHDMTDGEVFIAAVAEFIERRNGAAATQGTGADGR